MTEYSTRKALIDLGFINGYFYSRPSDIESDDWFDSLIDAFGRVEEICVKGSLLEANPTEKDYRQLLHDLGFIRGWAWQKKIPDAVSDAITRVIDYFSAALPVTDIVFAAPKPIERPEDMISDDTRHEVTTHYKMFPHIDGVASCNGIENHVTERIVAPIRDEEAEARLEIEIHGERESVADASSQLQAETPEVGVRSSVIAQDPSETVQENAVSPLRQDKSDQVRIRAFLSARAEAERAATASSNKRRAWTPERRAAAAERLRERQAAGKMKRRGPTAEPEVVAPAASAPVPEPVIVKNGKSSEPACVAEPPKVSLAKPEPLAEPPSPHRLTISHPDWAGKREDSQLHATDWPDIQQMLAKGRSRAAIAGDYDVSVGYLDEFIADQLREAQERRAAKVSASGEA